MSEPSDPRCPHHDDSACCPECPGHATTDGLGFPHPSEAAGRRALQRCRRCRKLVGRDRWVSDLARAFFGCRRCSKAKPIRLAPEAPP
jgi:hypothetical protein